MVTLPMFCIMNHLDAETPYSSNPSLFALNTAFRSPITVAPVDAKWNPVDPVVLAKLAILVAVESA